jgi:hypothetical protein
VAPDRPFGVPEHAALVPEYTYCGKCPKPHGPYWYAHWRDETGARRRVYVGTIKTQRV